MVMQPWAAKKQILKTKGERKMRKKGFTLIELLVVIAIIAMLLAILMPALGKVKKLAERLVCATNLRGLVTAGVIYSNDAEGYFPRQGGTTDHTLAYTTDLWDDPINKDWKVPGNITIAASLYLLIRYADVGPKSFVCRGGDETVFDGDNLNNYALEELWDFGGDPVGTYGQPKNYVSYAYHKPYPSGTYSSYPISTSDKTERAIIGDKSPYFDPKMTYDPAPTSENWEDIVAPIENDWDFGGVDKWQIKVGNSAAHEREGQNLGYGDCHVLFERRPDVAVRMDNVYTPFAGTSNFTEIARRIGGTPPGITSRAKTNRDSLLMNDDQRANP